MLVFARTSNASRLGSLALLAALVCTLGTGCKWKRKKAPSTAPSISTATTEAAALTGVPVDALPTAATAAPPPMPVDPLTPADHALIDQTSASVRDLEAIVKKGVLTNPEAPEAGDITTRCISIESARPRLDTLAAVSTTDADGEVKKLVAETKRLCSLEVPLLNANHALRQASLSPSQASRRLMCGLAQKDLDKAHSAKTSDRRVRELDARFGGACR